MLEEYLKQVEKEFDKEFKWFHINGIEQKVIDCPSLAKELKSFLSEVATHAYKMGRESVWNEPKAVAKKATPKGEGE